MGYDAPVMGYDARYGLFPLRDMDCSLCGIWIVPFAGYGLFPLWDMEYSSGGGRHRARPSPSLHCLWSVLKFKATNSALHQIKEAPSVRVSDLRSVVSEHGDSNQSEDGKLVIVRGTVEARSAVEGDWKSLRSDILVAHDSGERAVIVQRTQKSQHNELEVKFYLWREQHLKLNTISCLDNTEKRDGGPPLPCLSPETEEGDAACLAAASHSRSPEKKASPEFLLSSSVCVVVDTAEPPLRRFCSSKRERDEEVGCEGITSAWAGGENGRTVINKILLVADELLSERGWLYLLTLAANNPLEICLQMRKKGYASRVIL
nr:E3 ubiquitin-protein ligase SPL2 isoform X2 [Ipomoea trifida]